MVMVTEQSTSFELPVKKVAEQAAAFIRQNYQASISYDQIGETLHFHPNYISRCMKKVFNCTPLEYLIRFRLEQAKLQLLKTDQTITEVAQTVGFEHIPYFTRCFTKHEGLTPSVFRKRFGVHIKNN